MRAVQPAAGFVVNDPVEATYLNVSNDGEGKPLSGSNRYVIHFAKGGEPEVKAFWSVTMYNLKYNLVANPINRYSIGDRSGMTPDADGGLTIYVQKDTPGADKEANWLPAVAGTNAKCRPHRAMSEFGGEAENICEAPGDRQGVEGASPLR